MWRPPANFIVLHYAYIIFMGLVAFAVLYPGGNLTATDAYFFGASAATESGLNPVDVKELRVYQQLSLYVIPILTNFGFINIVVVVVRLLWFRRHLSKLGTCSPPAIHHPWSGISPRQDGTDLIVPDQPRRCSPMGRRAVAETSSWHNPARQAE
jgi:hypothetical protein